MPPENDNPNLIERRTDIFPLGAIIFLLLKVPERTLLKNRKEGKGDFFIPSEAEILKNFKGATLGEQQDLKEIISIAHSMIANHRDRPNNLKKIIKKVEASNKPILRKIDREIERLQSWSFLNRDSTFKVRALQDLRKGLSKKSGKPIETIIDEWKNNSTKYNIVKQSCFFGKEVVEKEVLITNKDIISKSRNVFFSYDNHSDNTETCRFINSLLSSAKTPSP